MTEAVAEEVVRLHDNQTDAGEIAQLLNLKRTQVNAIIAYFRPPKVADDLTAASNESDGDREHSRNGESDEPTDRSQLVEEYSSDPELEPAPAVPERDRRGDPSPEKDEEKDEGI